MISDQLRWDIEDERLTRCPKKTKHSLRKSGWSKNDIEIFERDVNDIIVDTSSRVAPYKLQFGGFILAALICIGATIVITVGDQALGGLLLFALGIIVLGGGFWYRDQLIQRKWKKIAQELSQFFQQLSHDHLGMQFEFHIRGHHSKKNKEGKQERTSVWYERYIILTLPSEDYIPPSKRASFRDVRGSGNKTTDQDEKFEVGYSQPERKERKFHDEDGNSSSVLPYWWLVGKDKEGRVYYINNFMKKTQWNPPTPDQIAKEMEKMNKVLPPPAFDPNSKSKQKFEEVKRRSIVKRKSLIEISHGGKPTKEAMKDVKPEDRPGYEERRKKSGKKRSRKN